MSEKAYKKQLAKYENNKKILNEIQELGEVTINEFLDKRKIDYNSAYIILTNLKNLGYLKVKVKESKKSNLNHSLRNHYSITEKKLIEPEFF